MTKPPFDVAPRWHTGLLVGLIVAVAVTGSLLQRYAAPQSPERALFTPSRRDLIASYCAMLAVNGGLLLYVCRPFPPGRALVGLLGRRWQSVGRAAADLGLAFATCVSIEITQALFVKWVAPGRNAAIAALLPSTVLTRVLWVLVAVSVGFCEEVVYRGYLQTQFTAFTRRPAFAIVLQALLFGLAHAQQGSWAAILVATYGLALGVVARSRQSLWPGIVSHIAIDVMSGLGWP